MTDLITRARKKWASRSGHAERLPNGDIVQQNWRPCAPCPPEVVAALLDVLETDIQYRLPSGAMSAAEAAIEKALEEK